MPLPSSCSAWVVCALSSSQCALAADNRQPCRRQSLGPLGILREAPGKSLWSSRGNTINLGWGEIAQFAEDSAWASKVGKSVRCGGSCYDFRLQRGSWRIRGITRPFCLVNERLDFNKHEMALEEQQLKVTISGLHMHIQTYVCIQTHLTPHTHTPTELHTHAHTQTQADTQHLLQVWKKRLVLTLRVIDQGQQGVSSGDRFCSVLSAKKPSFILVAE